MNIVKKHWPGFVLALIVGSCVAFPQLIVEHRMGAAFQGVHPFMSDDEIYYVARAHETLDGHPTLGNPYLAEHKDTPGVQFWMPDAFFATIDLYLFNNLHTGAVMWDFILPFIASLLTYAILYAVTWDRLASVAMSAFLLPGFFFLEFNRTPNPQLFLVLLASLLAFMHALKTRDLRWAVAAALTGGALFYVYPFYWTYWVVMVALGSFLSLLFVRDGRIFRLYAGVFGAALLMGIPYFLDSYRAMQLSYYKESLLRIGVIETHFPSGISVVALAGATILIMAWCWWKKIIPRKPETVLIASAAATGAIVMNQHIITGMNFQFTVHYTMPATFMSMFALALCAVPLWERASKFITQNYRSPVWWGISIVLALIALIHAVPQVRMLATPYVTDVAAQRYAPVLSWLDQHTKTDDVVYADPTLSLYIPAYTRDNVFFSSYAQESYMPDAEIEERFLLGHYFDPPLSREDIIRSEQAVFGAQYVGRWQHAETMNKVRAALGLAPISLERYPEEKIQSLIASEKNVQLVPFALAVQDYRVEYLLWDKVNDPSWRMPASPAFRKVYEEGDFVVYAVPKQ